ncbi:MAG: thiopurine S-methyltransferase [Pseudomonadota bacterium]
MEADFWHERWQQGRIAFHEGAPNRHLVDSYETLALPKAAHVFVPLCGKTVDLDWLLSKGYRVTGIELNRSAVDGVFERLQLTPEIERFDSLTRLSASHLVLWVGDLFKLKASAIGEVDAIYDRAALVALPPSTRANYTRHLTELCGSVEQLLITFDYDQSQTDGPPFSVPEDEVRRHYGQVYAISRLASVPIYGPLAERCSGREEAWKLLPLG